MIKLNDFYPRITEHQKMTGDRLSNLLFSLSKSNSDAVFFKSIESCATLTKPNLTVLGIENSISLERLHDDKKLPNSEDVFVFLTRMYKLSQK